jgi:hypothetical protein
MTIGNLFMPVIAALMICSVTSRAQVGVRVVILHEDIGVIIDKTEKDKYRLFTVIPDFHEAVFFHISEEGYLAIVSLVNAGGKHRDTSIFYSEGYLIGKAEQIAHFDAYLQGDYRIGTEPISELPTARLRDVSEYNPKWSTIIETAVMNRRLDSKAVSRRLQADTIRAHRSLETLEYEGEHDVRIVGVSGESVEGILLAVRDSAVVLEANWPFGVDPDTMTTDKNPLGRTFSVLDKDVLFISKNRIRGVTVIGDSHFFRNFMIGLLGGTLTGWLVGLILSKGPSASKDLEGIETGVGVMLGFIGGAVIGIVAGVLSTEGDIVLQPMTRNNYLILNRYTRYPAEMPHEYHIVR